MHHLSVFAVVAASLSACSQQPAPPVQPAYDREADIKRWTAENIALGYSPAEALKSAKELADLKENPPTDSDQEYRRLQYERQQKDQQISELFVIKCKAQPYLDECH